MAALLPQGVGFDQRGCSLPDLRRVNLNLFAGLLSQGPVDGFGGLDPASLSRGLKSRSCSRFHLGYGGGGLCASAFARRRRAMSQTRAEPSFSRYRFRVS